MVSDAESGRIVASPVQGPFWARVIPISIDIAIVSPYHRHSSLFDLYFQLLGTLSNALLPGNKASTTAAGVGQSNQPGSTRFDVAQPISNS